MALDAVLGRCGVCVRAMGEAGGEVGGGGGGISPEVAVVFPCMAVCVSNPARQGCFSESQARTALFLALLRWLRESLDWSPWSPV